MPEDTDSPDLKPCPLCTEEGLTAADPGCQLCHGTGLVDTQTIYAHMEQLWIGIHKFAKESLEEHARPKSDKREE